MEISQSIDMGGETLRRQIEIKSDILEANSLNSFIFLCQIFDQYKYGYSVASEDTGNYHARSEARDGETVSGSYKVNFIRCFTYSLYNGRYLCEYSRLKLKWVSWYNNPDDYLRLITSLFSEKICNYVFIGRIRTSRVTVMLWQRIPINIFVNDCN